MNENEFRIKGTDTNVTETIFERQKEISYVSKLDFNYFTNDNTSIDYIDEFNLKAPLLNSYDLLNEKDFYKWNFKLLEVLYSGKKLKKNNVENFKIESEIFFLFDLNLKKAHQKAFEILEFLESKLEKAKQLKKVEPTAKVEVKINPHIEIFKNDIGYTLFLDLHNIYKSKQNHLANYSFVFYALENDYLVCSGYDFKKFISTLDIHIDKIDTRQSGTNNRTPLFNSIQEKYLQ